LTETDDTQCRKADALFTSDLSTDYLHMIPDLHHMFVGLTQTEATHIVTMATAEIHPIDFEAAQQHSEATVFSATDEPRPSPEGGNNDVVSQHQETVNKDDVSDKKRKAVEAIPPNPAAQRMKGNGQPSGAMDPAIIDPGKPPPASDRIEGWLDDDAAADQGFIRTGRKMYRPPLPSLYTGPEVEDDLLDGHDWVYKEHGKALRHTKEPLPPRDNIIQFTDKPEYATELDTNLRVAACPPDHRAAVRDLVVEFWDCFTQDGLRFPIRGFEFVVDTGTAAPIACKIPRYGPHESQVIMTLIHAMVANDIVVKCVSAWAALVVLASKANQENVPWHEYVWRLCVSYLHLPLCLPYATV
jgi:hypothetical protein